MACAQRRPQRGSRGKAIRASCVVRARGRARRRSAPDNAWQVSASCSSVEPSLGLKFRVKGELLADVTGAPGRNYVTGALGINVTASNRVYWRSKPFTGTFPVTGSVNLPVILQCSRCCSSAACSTGLKPPERCLRGPVAMLPPGGLHASSGLCRVQILVVDFFNNL